MILGYPPLNVFHGDDGETHGRKPPHHLTGLLPRKRHGSDGLEGAAPPGRPKLLMEWTIKIGPYVYIYIHMYVYIELCVCLYLRIERERETIVCIYIYT